MNVHVSERKYVSLRLLGLKLLGLVPTTAVCMGMVNTMATFIISKFSPTIISPFPKIHFTVQYDQFPIGITFRVDVQMNLYQANFVNFFLSQIYDVKLYCS